MILYIVELAGVGLAAISAALLAGPRGLDVVSVLLVAYVTAFVGVTLRDFVINRTPVCWVRDPSYHYITLASCMATMLVVRLTPPIPQIYFVVIDALAMSLLAIVTARAVEKAHLPSLTITVVSCVAGSIGGVLRDLICMQVPQLLKQHIYITSLLAGVSVYLLLQGRGFKQPVSFWTGLAIILIFRAAAIFVGWELPFFNEPHMPFK